MAEPFIGQITLFAGNFAPRGWAFCQGQILSIAQNTALFSILGTTYGGNGQTTFALPDLRGRFPMQPGQGPGLSSRDLGEQSGTESVTLLTNNLPPHTHTASATARAVSGKGNSNVAAGNAWAKDAGVQSATYSTAAPDADMKPNGVNVQVGPTGGGQPVSITPPYTCLNFIIALEGIFPSRN